MGALERGLCSYGTWAWLLRDMWDLSRSGIESMSRALPTGFFTTEPPGRPNTTSFDIRAPSKWHPQPVLAKNHHLHSLCCFSFFLNVATMRRITLISLIISLSPHCRTLISLAPNTIWAYLLSIQKNLLLEWTIWCTLCNMAATSHM